MAKLVDLCGVCGGKGKFIANKCPSCNGTGGSVSKLNPEVIAMIEQNKSSLSEQEAQVWELYKTGFSQKEISKKMNLTMAIVASIFYRIQKKSAGIQCIDNQQ